MLFGGFQGHHSVRVLADGHILIYDDGLGHDSPESRAVDEVDPSGNVVWEGQLQSGGATLAAYRVRRLPSLYGFEPP